MRVLDVLDYGVQELPKEFGDLQSFVDFNASGHSFLSRLPESFSQLPNLKRLDLARCGCLQSLLTFVGGSTKLRVLDISYSRE